MSHANNNYSANEKHKNVKRAIGMIPDPKGFI